MKMNKTMPFAATWMELETLNPGSSQKDKEIAYDVISGIYYMTQLDLSTDKKIVDLENRLVVARWGVWGTWGSWMQTIAFGMDEQ